MDIAANQIASMMSIGMAIALSVADWRSKTSWALALFLLFFGLTGIHNAEFYRYASIAELPGHMRYSGISVGLTMIAGAEWILRVRRTIPAGELVTRFGDWQLRWAQAISLAYIAITIIFHEERANLVMFKIGQHVALHDPIFYLFAIPFTLPVLLLASAIALTLNRRPDWAERLRLIALIVAAPFMASGFFVPPTLTPYTVTIGLIIFLVGSVEYHVIQGQRGEFLGRFLSPEVRSIVRSEGIESSLHDETVELSVVYCDLRGFTAYSDAHPPEEVITLLREYYEIVGNAASNYGATIKDYAGDGVMLLVGAPVSMPDHAKRAIRLAVELRDRVQFLLQRRHDPNNPLGVGVGVSSGPTTVGVVGGNRLEYAAVGSTVNLAARLCDKAAAGEVLLSSATQEKLGNAVDGIRIKPAAALQLKGWTEPVPSYSTA